MSKYFFNVWLAGSYPSCYRVRVRVHLVQVASLSRGHTYMKITN